MVLGAVPVRLLIKFVLHRSDRRRQLLPEQASNDSINAFGFSLRSRGSDDGRRVEGNDVNLPNPNLNICKPTFDPNRVGLSRLVGQGIPDSYFDPDPSIGFEDVFFLEAHQTFMTQPRKSTKLSIQYSSNDSSPRKSFDSRALSPLPSDRW